MYSNLIEFQLYKENDNKATARIPTLSCISLWIAPYLYYIKSNVQKLNGF